jgi:hypothetical protein
MVVLSVVSMVAMMLSLVVVLVLPEFVWFRRSIHTGGFLIQLQFRDRSIMTATLGIDEARCQGDRGCQNNDEALDFHVCCERYALC